MRTALTAARAAIRSSALSKVWLRNAKTAAIERIIRAHSDKPLDEREVLIVGNVIAQIVGAMLVVEKDLSDRIDKAVEEPGPKAEIAIPEIVDAMQRLTASNVAACETAEESKPRVDPPAQPPAPQPTRSRTTSSYLLASAVSNLKILREAQPKLAEEITPLIDGASLLREKLYRGPRLFFK